MPQGDDSEFFSVSSVSPGIYSNQKAEDIKNSYFCKRKKKMCVAVLFLATVLIIIYLLKITNSSKIQKTKKTKRYLKINELNEVEGIKTLKTNIEIVPENVRMNQHPHGKHVEKEWEGKAQETMQTLSDRKAFKLYGSPKTHKRKGIRDAIGKGKRRNELLKDLRSSMRLRGVYIQSKSTKGSLGNQLNEKDYYSKEINNLMQSDSGGGGKERKWSAKKTYKSNGSPFQLPTKEKGNPKQQKANRDNFKFHQISNKHPITIYLDFYPMDNSENLKKKFKPDSPAGNKFPKPVPSGSVRVEKILLPQNKRNRMIMKLNLYPKESISSEVEAGSPSSRYYERAERKSLGCFFKQKKEKNYPKECSIMGLHPRGRQVTAR